MGFFFPNPALLDSDRRFEVETASLRLRDVALPSIANTTPVTMSAFTVSASALTGVRAPSGAAPSRRSAATPLRLGAIRQSPRGGTVQPRALPAGVLEKLAKMPQDDMASWESCKMLVVDLGLDDEAAEKCLVKAFGWCVCGITNT